jgi:hypothetical protein
MWNTLTRFLSINDLISDQGELAMTIKYDSDTQNALIKACTPLPDNTQQDGLCFSL